MNIATTIGVMASVLAMTCASTASAQQTTTAPPPQRSMPLGGNAFVNVNFGVQTRSSTTANDFSFPLYRETATVTTTADVDGGPIFDLSGGYRFTPSIGVALGYSSFSSTGTAQGSASIPNPLVFNQPLTVAIPAMDAKREERTVYVLVAGFFPITTAMDVSVFIGPSFLKAKQDFIAGVSVPPGTQVVNPALQTESGTATGINVGADLTYYILQQVGIGGFLRYNGGSVDLTTLKDVKVGGFQLGVGARVRF